MLVEQSSGPLDAFSKLASVHPGRRPAAHRRAAPFAQRLSCLQGVWGKGSLQAEGAAGGRELVFKGLAPPGRTSRVWRHSAAQEGTIPGFPGLATSDASKTARFRAFRVPLQGSRLGKSRFRARTARSGPKRPAPRFGKSGIVPKRRLKPFRGSEGPETRQRSSQDEPSRTAPIGQRPKGASPISGERGQLNSASRLALPFAGRALARPYGSGGRGRAAESSRPRVGRRDCPFVPLRQHPSRT